MEWITQHRYSDFERFDARLRALLTEYLDTNAIALPVLPPKPWLPQPPTVEFVESRARKLSRYMGALILVPQLQKRVQYLDLLLAFLSEGEAWKSAVTSAAPASLLGKGILAANNGLSKLLDARSVPSPDEDFAYIAALFKKQGLSQQIRPAWSKLVVSIFGTTSAGKSSLVNHLFQAVCAASSGAGQVDTAFSVYETVPAGEFAALTPEKSLREFSEAELRAPLRPADQNLSNDPRYGFVFVYLTAEETLDRYREQLSDSDGVLKQHNKLRTVLINERYLLGTPEERHLATRIILVDSKGVDAATLDSGDDTLWAEVKAMQFMSNRSHMSLFMLPADEIRNCAPAISVFELIVVASDQSWELLRQQQQDKKKEAAAAAAGGAGAPAAVLPSVVDPFNGLLYRMMGVDALYGVVQRAASTVASYLLPASALAIEGGTSRWQKTFFVLSKADQVLRSEPRDQLFYELGIAFGARLRYLQPPTFSRVALLGLPEKQPPGPEPPILGFLPELKKYLARQALDASYEASRDEAVIQMSELLERHMKQGWVSTAFFKFQGPYIRDARQRAIARRFAVTEQM